MWRWFLLVFLLVVVPSVSPQQLIDPGDRRIIVDWISYVLNTPILFATFHQYWIEKALSCLRKTDFLVLLAPGVIPPRHSS